MSVTLHDVRSSHVRQIGHDPDTQEMHVVWDSGRTSVFTGVPANVADRVRKSHSVGKALGEEVKGKYGHRYA